MEINGLRASRPPAPRLHSAAGMPKTMRSAHGFTLVELVVVLAILIIALLIGMPALFNSIRRTQMESTAQQLGVFVRQARLEAIRRSAPCVVRVDPTTRQLSSFVDINDAGGNPVADLELNPVAGQARGTTDYQVAVHTLPDRLTLAGPPEDPEGILGFVDPGSGPRLVFNPDGAAVRAGAFRIADDRGNFIEVSVSPATTGRIRLRKWDPVEKEWETRDSVDGKAQWEWY